MSRKQEKQALLQLLENSRHQLSADLQGVGESLNVPRRIQRSFHENSIAWLAGGAAAGLILALLTGRHAKRKVSEKVKVGFVRGALFSLTGVMTKQILRSSLPALQRMALEGLERWAVGRQEPPVIDENLKE
ncbi:MAG: hypothetical protein HKN23_15890 [Verrucomicrobiales bacterium]|nr:hypothetical protein [Verrucomicrobiales bacterium]